MGNGERALILVSGLGLCGCPEYHVHPPAPAPVAEPPGAQQDAYGDPPDWSTCAQGYRGFYYNLPAGHSDVLAAAVPDTGAADALPAITRDGLDWWDADYLSYEDYEASLDFGGNWYPVDDGLEGDPDGFAVRWVAWMRVTEDADVQVQLGAATDAWLLIDEQEVAAVTGARELVTESFDLRLETGQFPMDLYHGHRGGDTAGFRFRVVSGAVSICYPDYDTKDEG